MFPNYVISDEDEINFTDQLNIKNKISIKILIARNANYYYVFKLGSKVWPITLIKAKNYKSIYSKLQSPSIFIIPKYNEKLDKFG